MTRRSRREVTARCEATDRKRLSARDERGNPSRAEAAPRTTTLPDVVKEGADYPGTLTNALATRDSRAEQIDYGTAPTAPQVRVLRFNQAGHLWPVSSPGDRDQEIAEFGLRNQDLHMSDAVWEFFRSSL